jgi:hypothetical protein
MGAMTPELALNARFSRADLAWHDVWNYSQAHIQVIVTNAARYIGSGYAFRHTTTVELLGKM